MHTMSASSPVHAHERLDPRGGARLRLLGGFELEIDEVIVELQPALERLIALVALASRSVTRSFTAFQLWPDTTETRARANLRSTLWRLNRVHARIIGCSTTHLRLDQKIWVDIHDAQHTDREHGDPSRGAPRPFNNMLSDLLPDWYDDWLVIERERYRQLSLSQLDRRARVAIDAGDPGAALQYALAALATEGTRTTSHRLVVEAHLADGNSCEAERERARYRRCREHFIV